MGKTTSKTAGKTVGEAVGKMVGAETSDARGARRRDTVVDRRGFLKAGAAVGAATAVLSTGVVGADATNAAGAVEISANGRLYSGADMREWVTVVGDGVYVPKGIDPIAEDDIAALHLGGHTELLANIKRRPVMAHNTTYYRVDDDEALGCRHRCTSEFRMPYVPTTTVLEENAQTLELAHFTWDGGSTRLDYGSGFQWMLNPWMDNFGDIRVWSADGTEWLDSGHRLTPDLAWHDFSISVDHVRHRSALRIDKMHIDLPFSATKKPEYWGTETASRFAIETINAYPGTSYIGSTHRAQFRDWSWRWQR